MCILRLYFWTNVILQCLHLKVNSVLQGVTPSRLFEKNASGHSLAEVLFLLYVCPYIVVLDKSDIALFTFKITFFHAGSDI